MFTYKYPHPAVTADAVVFGFDGHELNVLLVERGLPPYKGMWALPGGFMRIEETAEQCAARELAEETGVRNVYLEQFHTFSSVHRDPRERVITVAFIALIRKSDFLLSAGDDAADANWFVIDELPPLAFDHREILDMARKYLREALRNRPLAFKLLDKQFAIDELRRVFEAINGTQYDRRNFAKKMLASGYLSETDATIDERRKAAGRDVAVEGKQRPTRPSPTSSAAGDISNSPSDICFFSPVKEKISLMPESETNYADFDVEECDLMQEPTAPGCYVNDAAPCVPSQDATLDTSCVEEDCSEDDGCEDECCADDRCEDECCADDRCLSDDACSSSIYISENDSKRLQTRKSKLLYAGKAKQASARGKKQASRPRKSLAGRIARLFSFDEDSFDADIQENDRNPFTM